MDKDNVNYRLTGRFLQRVIDRSEAYGADDAWELVELYTNSNSDTEIKVEDTLLDKRLESVKGTAGIPEMIDRMRDSMPKSKGEEYKMLDSSYISSIKNDTKRYIEEGWKPLGGIFTDKNGNYIRELVR